MTFSASLCRPYGAFDFVWRHSTGLTPWATSVPPLRGFPVANNPQPAASSRHLATRVLLPMGPKYGFRLVRNLPYPLYNSGYEGGCRRAYQRRDLPWRGGGYRRGCAGCRADARRRSLHFRAASDG